MKKKRKNVESSTSKTTASTSSSVSPSPKKSKPDEDQFSNLLIGLASQCTNESMWNPNPDVESTSSSSVMKDHNVFLHPSEGLISDDDDDDNDNDDNEKASKHEDRITSDNIEIHIQTPNPNTQTQNKKRNNKVSKHESKLRRLLESFLHKTGVVCGIAHLIYLHIRCSEDVYLRALALSVFPPAHSSSQKLTTMKLSQFVTWFHETTSVLTDNDHDDEMIPYEFHDAMAHALRTWIFQSNPQKVLTFYLLVRSVGWKTRLIYVPPITSNLSSSSSSSLKKSKTKSESIDPRNRYWIEIYIDRKWITVDPIHGKTNCTKELEYRTPQPILYVLALNPDGTIKEVTAKYVSQYLVKIRKSQVPYLWLTETLRPFEPRKTVDEDEENKSLETIITDCPIPSTMTGLKGHPLYVTPKHLLQHEVLYPPDVKPIGYIKKEPVYKREAVHKLKTKMTWFKEGMIIKEKERPRKTVKGEKEKEKYYYGAWQVQKYEAPRAQNGKVPRNEYGNVEIYQPWMLPKGTVHIPISGLNKVAQKLGIDCVPAVVGWDYHVGGSHPVCDGFVVCTESQEILMDAWNNEEDIKSTKDVEKKTNRILNNWKKLTKGLLLREKIKFKYK